MKYIKIWLFLFLFVTAPAGNADCSRWLIPNTSSKVLDDVIRDQMTSMGLKLEVKTRSTFFTRWRAKKLVAQMDGPNFNNENFRNEWVERVVALKVDESLDPLENIKQPISEDQRLTLTRLVLRSLIHRGLSAPSNAGGSLWRDAIRRVRFHPMFRLIFSWQLPRKTITLNDEQILALVERGASEIGGELAPVVKSEDREMFKRKANKLTAMAISVTLAASTAWAAYPTLDAAYEQGHSMAVQQNTEKFIKHVGGTTQISADTITLQMARSEIQVLTADFVKRFGENPTASEAQELRGHVCKIRYGDFLSSDSLKQCLSEQ